MRRTRRALVDQFGDHRAACAQVGCWLDALPSSNAHGFASPREAVAAEGRIVPQQCQAQWCVAPDDRCRLDLVIYGASRRGEALCCDVTLVSPLRADGRPQPASSERDGAAIDVGGGVSSDATLSSPARLVVLAAAEVGGRWGQEARPRPSPRAPAFPSRAAGAASCCPCGVGSQVVGAAG